MEEAKGRYSSALRNLEKISSDIHLQRKLDSHLRDLFAEREETIGAEDDSVMRGNTEFDLRQTKTYGMFKFYLEYQMKLYLIYEIVKF